MNKQTFKTILKVIGAIVTALLGVFGSQELLG